MVEMASWEFSIEDVLLPDEVIQRFYESWRYPEITTSDGEIKHTIIDESGTRHYGFTARDRRLRNRNCQTEFQLEHYRDAVDLFRTLYSELVSELPNTITKKEEIVFTKLVFGDSVSAPSDPLFGLATQIDRVHAHQFRYDRDTQMIFQREPVPNSLRQELIEEYDGCAKCGVHDDIEIHHIIPHVEGGSAEQENLAPLCHDCHADAHSGGLPVHSQDCFTDWIHSSRDDN